MGFRIEVMPFLAGSMVAAVILGVVCRLFGVTWMRAGIAAGVFAVVAAAYFLWFFRDPPRTPPVSPRAIPAGAEGTVMQIVEMEEPIFLKTNAVRITIFLSPFNVHVNRSPIAGRVTYLDYRPGKRYFTFLQKSECNQHSNIVIEGAKTRCLVRQICGPVCRRVVYWLTVGQELQVGDRIGMMKFGSRLDMFFPKDDVRVVAKVGDRVKAGETVVAERVRE